MVRPTQQSSTKRKRKSNDLIWARDGDHKNAQEHPCYLLENNCNEGAPSNDNDEKVWVEWSSNGTVACIPKSRISTTGLSSRRKRTNTKQPVVNNVQQTTSNKQKKRAPPRKRSNGGLSTLLSKRKKHSTVGNSTTNSNSNITIAIPEQILVEGCGIPEVNGTYELQVDNARRTDGLSVDEGDVPVYSKKGIWQGKVVDFEIYRTASRLGYGHWYIGTRYKLLPSVSFYTISYKRPPPLPNRPQRIGKIPFMPPVEGWERNDYGEAYRAYNPLPTLTYKYKSEDDNITSSVSDNNKVKTEDSTKVKEDNEEDKKIAAVPTAVVSSQLTKSAYDEDTDDDVAPDPVQSSNLKSKKRQGKIQMMMSPQILFILPKLNRSMMRKVQMMKALPQIQFYQLELKQKKKKQMTKVSRLLPKKIQLMGVV